MLNMLRNSILFVATALAVGVCGAASFFMDAGDFTNAKVVYHRGEVLVISDLSDSGFSKMKKLNDSDLNKPLEIRIADENIKLTLRSTDIQRHLQLGPFSDLMAKKIVDAINLGHL